MVTGSFSLKPEEAIDYWAWRNPVLKEDFKTLSEEMKDRAFVISKLTQYRHLQEVYNKIGECLSEGKATGTVLKELKKGKDGVPLSEGHLETVIRTNLANAYGAGRWAQVQRTKDTRPYLKILVVDDGRSSDVAFKDSVFPADDPFWQVNWPPFHFNCRCEVISLSERQVAKMAEKLGHNPVVHTTNPMPINAQFARRPGTPHKPDLSSFDPVFRDYFLNDAARQFGVDEAGEIRMKKYFNDGDVKDALLLARIGKLNQKAFEKMVADTLASAQAKGNIIAAGKIPAEVSKYLKGTGNSPRLGLITMDDKQILHMQRDVKQEAGKALTADDIKNIPKILSSSETRWYWDDNKHPSLIAFNGNTKVTVGINSDNGTPYVITGGYGNEGDFHKYKKIK